MFRKAGFTDAARVGAGRMEKSPAGAPRAVDDFFREQLKIVGIVMTLVANHVDEPGPAAAKADDLVTFTQSAEGDCADGGIEAGNVAAPGEDADDPFLGLDGCHEWMARPFAGWRTGDYLLCSGI